MENSRVEGFGLVEVLIAVAITAVVALGLAPIFNMLNSNSTNLQGNAGAQSLRSTLLQVTAAPSPGPTPVLAPCYNNLLPAYKSNGYFQASKVIAQGLPLGFTGSDGTSIQGADPNATPMGTPTPLANYNISLNYLVFKAAGPLPLQQAGTDLFSSAPLYLGSLVASVTKSSNPNQQSIMGGATILPITIASIFLAVDGTGTIKNCYSRPIDGSQACAAIGGYYNPSATPPNTICQLPYPCTSGTIFTGYGSGGVPTCVSAATLTASGCPTNGQTIVFQSGAWVCQ